MPIAAELNQAETRWFKFTNPVDRGHFILMLGWKFARYVIKSKDDINKNIKLKL